jgi:hypothetical protein
MLMHQMTNNPKRGVIMNLNNYFTEHTGIGVLATADKNGIVNTAIYARPHVFDDATLGFIMRDRLSRKNLLENGHAGYLFLENDGAYKGLRLRLKLIGESTDHELLSNASRSHGGERDKPADEQRFFVTFSLEKCFSLIGGEELEIE